VEATDISLRPVIAADVDVFFEHQRDPVAAGMAAFPARDRDAHETHWARILDDPAVVARTIVIGGEVAGNIGCWEHDGNRFVGYWIGRDHWGKGIATEALIRLLDLVPARPLYALVAKDNAASIRVLAKCGFEVTAEKPADEDGIVELEMKLGL